MWTTSCCLLFRRTTDAGVNTRREPIWPQEKFESSVRIVSIKPIYPSPPRSAITSIVPSAWRKCLWANFDFQIQNPTTGPPLNPKEAVERTDANKTDLGAMCASLPLVCQDMARGDLR